jgi:hypothetical protein
MASKLNPTAAEFIPGSFTESYISTDEASEVSLLLSVRRLA